MITVNLSSLQIVDIAEEVGPCYCITKLIQPLSVLSFLLFVGFELQSLASFFSSSSFSSI